MWLSWDWSTGVGIWYPCAYEILVSLTPFCRWLLKRPDPPPTGILLVVDLHKFNVVPEIYWHRIWRNFTSFSLVCDVVHPLQSCNCLITCLAGLSEPVKVIGWRNIVCCKISLLIKFETRQLRQSHFLQPAFPGLDRWPPLSQPEFYIFSLGL